MGLDEGLQLIREGAYFEAHEELEDEWRTAPTDERDFLQGLVHVAVAWLHAERGNRNGCERQLVKAERRLGGTGHAIAASTWTTILDDVATSTPHRRNGLTRAARRRVDQKAGSSPSHSRKRFR